MKKILLFLAIILITQNSFAWWTNLANQGTPVYSYYLGDKLAYIFYFSVNQETSPMTVSYGLGTTTNGTGWTWRAAQWGYQTGDDRYWMSKANEHQFTSTGNWYYSGRFVWTADGYTEYASAGFAENRTTLVATSYFTVNALDNPSDQLASRNPTSPSPAIDLSWTKDEQNHNVMILRKLSTDSWPEISQGTTYSLDDVIGDAVVVYNSNGEDFTDTDLTSATGYDYKFYSENNNYYSAGIVTATVFTSPSVFTVGGGGSYCSGGSVNITLDDSEAGVTYELWKDDVATGTTLSGTGNALDFQNVTAAGTYTIKGTIDDITVTMTGSAIVTVNALPAAVTVEGAGTFCATATITASIEGDGTIYFQGTTSGGTSIDDESTSEEIISSGTYYFRALSAEGCWGAEGSAEVTINAAITPSVSIVASANPVVSGTSVTFTATPVNGGTPPTTYQWYLNGNPSGFNQPTLTYNPLNNNTIYVVMTSSLPCTSPVQSNTITMIVTTAPANSTWDGSTDNDWHTAANWSDGVPGSTTDVIIPFTGITKFPTISSAATCHNFTLKSGASILGNNKLSVTGITSVERFFVGNEWHLLSSPILNANTGMFTGKYLQYHNETNNKYYDILSADSVITVAKGYAVWGGSGFTKAFVGPLNDNNMSYPVKKAGLGWNLVGNPYPSYIDWNASGWTKTNVNATIYIHVNASTWATWNGTTQTGSGSRYIAPCQGFFVEANANGTLGMSNAVRTHQTAPYYKSSEDVVPNLIRLEISGNGFKDDAVVYFTPTATTEFDGESDARKLFGDVAEAPQIYSFGPTPLAINTLRELASVPVGIHAGTNGTFTIAATEINDLSYVTLEDTKTGVFTELANKSYTFDFIAGENEQRFKLHFSSVGIDEKETTTASIYSYQQTVYVNLADNTQGDIYIYNLAGQLITAQESASGNVRIGLNSLGVYMVKVVTEKETLTQKVVIR